jgi:hypothetical protein
MWLVDGFPDGNVCVCGGCFQKVMVEKVGEGNK